MSLKRKVAPGVRLQRRAQRVVWERITSSLELTYLHEEWDHHTASLPLEERYRHATWAALVVACDAHCWTDSTEAALVEDAKKIAERKRVKAFLKPVPRRIAGKIDEYRDERKLDMTLLGLQPTPPLWLRNRSPERRDLIADAWHAREMLLEAGAKASGREVMERLKEQRCIASYAPDGLKKRVEEALRRADQLISDGDWPPFDAEPPPVLRQHGQGMDPAVVYQLLED